MEDYFTVVWWDQRGAGLSYSSNIDKSTLTVDQYIDDIIAVTNYLRERFGQDKIYLMAHSWGTYFGIQAVQKAPQLYKAYIAVRLPIRMSLKNWRINICWIITQRPVIKVP